MLRLKLKHFFRSLLPIVTGIVVLFFYQNCDIGFETAQKDGNSEQTSSLPTPSPTPPTPPPAGFKVFFHSDWSTLKGKTGRALRDMDKTNPWTQQVGALADNQTAEVRGTAENGRDYPSANYLWVPDDYAHMEFSASDNYYSAPAEEQSIYLRMYYRLILNGTGGDTHGTYFDDSVANPNWGPQLLGFYNIPSAGNTFTSWLTLGNDQPFNYFDPRQEFNKNQTYRIEVALHRTGTLTYQVETRVYNINNELIYDTSHYTAKGYYGSTAPDLMGTTFTTTANRFDSLAGFRIGLESPQVGAGGGFCEYAAIAICNDWCGAYPISGVEN